MKEIIGALESSTAKITMFADGFVDEVWEIINSRTSMKDYTLYTKMNEFAERITSSGSGGVGLELIQKRRAFGGFAANIGYAAARLGVNASLIGVFGKEKLDPTFEEVGEICRMFSVDNPSVTHVFEFDDGKILMTHMESVQEVSWKSITAAVGIAQIKSLIAESALIGIGYWSLLPAFDEILEQVINNMPNDNKERRFFFDFADFRKRDESSLKSTLESLRKLNDKFPMTLSVNEHEGAALFNMYNETFDDAGRPIKEKAEAVRRQMGLDEFVIHAPNYAVAATSKEEPAFEPSVFCEKPVRTAGAGDTFNGGYIAARLAGLDISRRLQTANAAVGYFIRNAAFPGIEDLGL